MRHPLGNLALVGHKDAALLTNCVDLLVNTCTDSRFQRSEALKGKIPDFLWDIEWISARGSSALRRHLLL
jgi:hypothetical protein